MFRGFRRMFCSFLSMIQYLAWLSSSELNSPALHRHMMFSERKACSYCCLSLDRCFDGVDSSWSCAGCPGSETVLVLSLIHEREAEEGGDGRQPRLNESARFILIVLWPFVYVDFIMSCVLPSTADSVRSDWTFMPDWIKTSGNLRHKQTFGLIYLSVSLSISCFSVIGQSSRLWCLSIMYSICLYCIHVYFAIKLFKVILYVFTQEISVINGQILHVFSWFCTYCSLFFLCLRVFIFKIILQPESNYFHCCFMISLCWLIRSFSHIYTHELWG